MLPKKPFQFSLAAILLCIGVMGVLLGLWNWLSETVPGALAVVIVLCWAGGLLLLIYSSKIDDNYHHSVVQILFGLACGSILIGPLIAVVIWWLWN